MHGGMEDVFTDFFPIDWDLRHMATGGILATVGFRTAAAANPYSNFNDAGPISQAMSPP